jgi:very-short-patch-repair endonuclease
MPIHTPVPEALRHGPFTRAGAQAAGLERWHLDTARYRRLGRDAFAWVGLPVTPELRLSAALLHLPRSAVVCGRTAVWLHRLDWTFVEPIEVTIAADLAVRARSGVHISRAALPASEIVIRRSRRVTSVVRTLLDVGRNLAPIDAVPLADAALYKSLTSVQALEAAVQAVPGTRNVERLRKMLMNVEPLSESLMESRLRMTLIEGGLPRPQAQVDLHDASDNFLGRADLYYPSHRLILEYDGGNHRDSLIKDDRRQNRLLEAGYVIRRFTAPDVMGTPDLAVAQIRGELAGPAWRLAA